MFVEKKNGEKADIEVDLDPREFDEHGHDPTKVDVVYTYRRAEGENMKLIKGNLVGFKSLIAGNGIHLCLFKPLASRVVNRFLLKTKSRRRTGYLSLYEWLGKEGILDRVNPFQKSFWGEHWDDLWVRVD